MGASLSPELLFSILTADILPIFAIAGIGFLLARRTDISVKTLTTIVFNALSPCLVFNILVTSKMTGSQAGLMALYFLLLTAAMGVVGRLAAAPFRLDRETLSSFLLVVMFSNSGNYALPVVLFAFGREALSYASVYFVMSAITVYTVGVFIAGSGRGSFGRAAMGIFRVPALYAVAAAGMFALTHTVPPETIMRPVGMLSDAALPMMLIVLGMQLKGAVRPKRPKVAAVAVALSLFVSPLLGVFLTLLLGLSDAARQAAIILAAMPAAVITTVLAVEFDLDPNFVTSVVFATTLLSPFTLVLLIAYLRHG